MEKFCDYVDNHIEVVKKLKSDDYLTSNLDLSIIEIVKKLKLGGKLLACGNGGSAAD